MPFREDTLAKSLDEPSTLQLYDNLPRLDGARAFCPLYAAFVQAVYAEWEEKSLFSFTSDDNVPWLLLNGDVDIVFFTEISEEHFEAAREQELELKLTPIGREAFVFFANRSNPVSNLSVGNVRDIYSGRITNWREVGGVNSRIRAFQRIAYSASNSHIKMLEIMGNIPMMEPREKTFFIDTISSPNGMERVVSDYRNYKNALGYSFRYYIKDFEKEVKHLSVNGTAPTPANIASGAYPFSYDIYAVTAVREPETEEDAARMENTERLIEWILSPQGQSLVEKTGYVPLG